MLNTKVVISGVFIFSLMGCGGGGGGGSSSSTPVDETPVVEDPVSVLPEEASIDIVDLRASDDFTFTSKDEIDVSLDLSSDLDSDERAYVSVYSDYSVLDSGEFYADASSRVVAGNLQDSAFNSSFTSLTDQSTYLIEVWSYSGEKPLQKEQTVVDSKLTW